MQRKHKRKLKKVKKIIKKTKKPLFRKKRIKSLVVRKKKIKNKKKIAKKFFKKIKIKKKTLTPIIKKKALSLPKEDKSSPSLFKAKIRIIGIGGGGGSIVSEIGKSLEKVTFVVADTDSRAFLKKSKVKYFPFGREHTHGLGTGLNVNLAFGAAEQEKEQIQKLFEGQDIVILIASLGGGVGSGATKVFADVSAEFDCVTFGIFTLPFKFEGKSKQAIAKKALSELRNSLNVSLAISNEKIFKIINKDTSITEAFSMVNRNLVASLESLIDLIYNPGLINIDFADVKAILKGKGNLAFLNSVEMSGKNRSDKVIQEILHNPLYSHSQFAAEKILFNIAGSNNLSMFEVDKISRAIAEENPGAKIIFGIQKNLKYKSKIKTTLLMTGQSKVGNQKMEKPLPVKKQAVVKKSKIKNKKVKDKKEKTTPTNTFSPVFNPVVFPMESVKRLSIEEKKQPAFEMETVSLEPQKQKKAIRRSALEIKKAEELEENKKSLQEKEWEIPAFLRKIKFKP